MLKNINNHDTEKLALVCIVGEHDFERMEHLTAHKLRVYVRAMDALPIKFSTQVYYECKLCKFTNT